MLSFRSAVAASYAMFTGWLIGRFQTGKVSNLAYPDDMPRLFSWYSCDRHTAIFPLPGPGAVTTTRGLVVST